MHFPGVGEERGKVSAMFCTWALVRSPYWDARLLLGNVLSRVSQFTQCKAGNGHVTVITSLQRLELTDKHF